MVHNNNHQRYFDISLRVACLPAIQGQLLPHLVTRRWNMKPFESTENNENNITAHVLTLEIPATQNSRVLRCLSDNVQLDVTGIFGRQGDDYTPQYSTVSKSRGENFAWSLPPLPRSVAVNRLPKLPHPIAGELTSLSLQDAGLYSFKERGKDPSYAKLIVRSCPRDRYGADCSQWCPDCRNSGECHPASGRCVCAPGTYGDRCEHYCPEDRYGATCQLSCTSKHLRWSTWASCSGLTFCTHDPKGCSCPPGYQPPTCDQGCGRGSYGPDCALSCRYCRDGSCDPRNGRCHQGCLDPALCDAHKTPRNLPRFRAAPNVTSLTHAKFAVSLRPWSPDSDEGILEPGNSITGYILQVKALEDPETAWVERPISLGSTELRYNFIPGRSYAVRTLVVTSSGSADAAYNLRIPQTQLDLPCLDDSTYGEANLFPVEVTQVKITIAGVNAAPCRGPEYEFTVKEYLAGTTVKTENTASVQPSVDGLSPNTTYVVSVNSASITITTLPEPPTVSNLNSDAEATNVRLTWSAERSDNFTVAWRKLKPESCRSSQFEPANSTQATRPSAFLSSLDGFTRYEVCVQAFNMAGGSRVECGEFVTKPNRGPTLQLQQLSCRPNHYSDLCSVRVAGDCSDFHGPNLTLSWRLTGAPACNASAPHSVAEDQRLHNVGMPTQRFEGLTPFVGYNVSVTVTNAYGSGSTLNTTFTSQSDTYPAPVEDLQWTATASSVTLRWRQPCPPRAQISSYRLSGLPSGYQYLTQSACPDEEVFFCYTVVNLPSNKKYHPKVASCAPNNYCYTEVGVQVITKQTVPGPPTFSVEVEEQSFTIRFTFMPANMGISSCNVETYHGATLVRNTSVKIPKDSEESQSLKISDLAASSVYQLSAYCRNSEGASKRTNQTHATRLLPPKVLQPPFIQHTTSTNATLILPRLEKAGDSNIVSFTIMVHNLSLSTDPVNFTSKFLSWQPTTSGDRPRRSSEDCPTNEEVYIAGQLSQDESEFVIGSGEAPAGMSNCPLVEGNSYDVAVVVLSVLADQKYPAVVALPQPFVAGPGGISALATVAIFFTIVLVAVLIFVLVYRRRLKDKCQMFADEEKLKDSPVTKPHFPKNLKQHLAVKQSPPKPTSGEFESVPLAPVKVEANPKPSRASSGGGKIVLPPTNKVAPHGKPVLKVKPVTSSSVSDSVIIYENQEGTTSSSQVVQLADMEGYLNETICSSDIMHQFSAMPTTYEKPMTDAEKPENRQKNRYRNNYPYNDTRVRLKIMNDDPNSDYINANFIKGACDTRRYIASQGPKEKNLCTISDFWRMVVEQDVNVIIMVANFNEKNIVKVGKYFSYEGQVALPDVEGTVTLVSTETTSYCTISKIQVELKYDNHPEVRRVSHYHFTKWPDHGVPVETLTLSHMLKHIATSHENLNAVVHCSAGIGRTGTVIYDLVCYDYLQFAGKVDLMQVLQDLRLSRARLVENQMQFKLCLQLLDEILFGFHTVTLAPELDGAMESLLQESHNWFQRLNSLPSSLSFSTASWNENLPLNRSPNILPADSHRIYVQSTSGQQLYVNAIRIEGLQSSEACIVAEHPLPDRLEPFWNVVLSKKCPSVVMLNPHYDENFPPVFPKDETELVAGSVRVQLVSQTLAVDDLTAHKFSVSNGKSTMSVTGYEVTGWHRDTPTPPDVTSLVRLADVLHSSASSAAGPPLLVCGDGVTACGLTAGVLWVVDRIKERQDIDVYRTAVKLRRCRSQFFVSEVQLQQMLHAAQIYLSEFQDYSNFK